MTAAVTLGLVPNAWAQAPAPAAPPAPPAINLGAVVFYDYTYALAPETTDAAGQDIHANGFNVARTYLNVTGRISPIVSFRVTPDITRTSNSGGTTDGSLTFRLKYGYAQFDLDQFTGAWTGTWIRAGIQQTPFIDGAESVYRYRFQGTMFAERDGGMSSADAGVSAHTNLPKGYGDVHVGLYNGEGYTKAEVNDQKALMLRATVRPLPETASALRGLRLTAYVHRDHVMRNAERHRFIGSAWFEHARVNAGVDYLTREDRATPDTDAVDSDGLSFFVTPFLETKGDGFELLLRHDAFRPDTTASLRRHRTIAGVAYWMPHVGGRATAALMLDLEQVRYSNDPDDRPTERRVIVHGLINF
jgi:hypothetical protein